MRGRWSEGELGAARRQLDEALALGREEGDPLVAGALSYPTPREEGD